MLKQKLNLTTAEKGSKELYDYPHGITLPGPRIFSSGDRQAGHHAVRDFRSPSGLSRDTAPHASLSIIKNLSLIYIIYGKKS
jgi:hypothetical protein